MILLLTVSYGKEKSERWDASVSSIPYFFKGAASGLYLCKSLRILEKHYCFTREKSRGGEGRGWWLCQVKWIHQEGGVELLQAEKYPTRKLAYSVSRQSRIPLKILLKQRKTLLDARLIEYSMCCQIKCGVLIRICWLYHVEIIFLPFCNTSGFWVTILSQLIWIVLRCVMQVRFR